MTDVDDESLARRAAAGDRNAFSALLERHYGLIYRVGARMLGDRVEAEDLAQDVLEIITVFSARLDGSRSRTHQT